MLKKFTITMTAVAMLAASALPAFAADGKLGAIASSDASYGVSYMGSTRAEARTMALAKCKAMAAKSGDATKCRADFIFAHCAAVATTDKAMGEGYGDTPAEAKTNAMKFAGKGAKMVESGCVGK
jgi:hypothetical protein